MRTEVGKRKRMISINKIRVHLQNLLKMRYRFIIRSRIQIRDAEGVVPISDVVHINF